MTIATIKMMSFGDDHLDHLVVLLSRFRYYL